MNKTALAITTIALFLLAGAASYAAVPELTNLDPSKNGNLRSLREDIGRSLYVIKSRRPEKELPELKFYSYCVKKDDTFWTILARSSQDIDTLLSVNGFTTPKDIRPGKKIFIPNMRGVILKEAGRAAVARMLSENRVRPEYVYRINGTRDLGKKYLFVPCGRLSNLERSLFLGTGFMAPLQRSAGPHVTSRFGTRRSPFNQRYTEFHAGVDVSCPRGSDVLAARDGKVVYAGFYGGYGNLVVLQHEYGYQSLYGHLSRPLVKAGDRIKRGQVIARSGNTGRTTGPHLHFEVRRGGVAVNPGILLKE
jgi:murein DD-endopeptidase MepM/ murein hydrolase activator NlpD